jgi:hypothetical protein
LQIDAADQPIEPRMSLYFEELDWRPTPIGTLSLRRRRELSLGVDVHEIKLGDEFLMSSLFTESEVALARLALAQLSGSDLDVVVGGLGLGYTARAVLEHEEVRSLLVVEMLEPVIEWHKHRLAAARAGIDRGSRTLPFHRRRFLRACGIRATASTRMHHSAGSTLSCSTSTIRPTRCSTRGAASFYRAQGLGRVAAHLQSRRRVRMWSNDAPDDNFTARLAGVFADASPEPVTFHNPLQDRPFTQTVYLARKAMTSARCCPRERKSVRQSGCASTGDYWACDACQARFLDAAPAALAPRWSSRVTGSTKTTSTIRAIAASCPSSPTRCSSASAPGLSRPRLWLRARAGARRDAGRIRPQR